MAELMGNQKVYNKGNSLLEIRGNNKSSHKVLQRIRSVYKGVQGLMENDPLSKALDDLLIEPNSTEREPQFILRDHVVDEIDRLKDDELNRYLRYRYMYDVYPINKILSAYNMAQALFVYLNKSKAWKIIFLIMNYPLE